MEQNYRLKEGPVNRPKREKHLPLQTEPKQQDYNPLLVKIPKSGYMSIPAAFLSLLIPRRIKPFKHEKKEVPKKLRQKIGERLSNICELECEEEGRVLFLATGRSGAIYEVTMRKNYSKVLKTRKVF